MYDHHEHDHDGLWIRTEPSIDGTTFIVTLSIGADWSATLTPIRAFAYAGALLAAVADAEYDAAILSQMTKRLNLNLETASQLVLDMRGERPARTASGLTFVPGVSQARQHAFIILEREVDGERVQMAQLDAPAARRHAMHVLEAPVQADLDAAYLKILRGSIGLDEAKARGVVEDIMNHRAEWTVADA